MGVATNRQDRTIGAGRDAQPLATWPTHPTLKAQCSPVTLPRMRLPPEAIFTSTHKNPKPPPKPWKAVGPQTGAARARSHTPHFRYTRGRGLAQNNTQTPAEGYNRRAPLSHPPNQTMNLMVGVGTRSEVLAARTCARPTFTPACVVAPPYRNACPL